MDLVRIGKIVNTHGIKGELRLLSDFKYKEDIFKIGNYLYIGHNLEKLEINSYRVHKNYDMITFKGLNNINDVLIYKGDDAFINREEYHFDGILYEDLIGLDVIIDENKYGVVDSLMKSVAHPILVIIDDKNNKHMVPYIDQFVEDVDLDKHIIKIKVIDGLL